MIYMYDAQHELITLHPKLDSGELIMREMVSRELGAVGIRVLPKVISALHNVEALENEAVAQSAFEGYIWEFKKRLVESMAVHDIRITWGLPKEVLPVLGGRRTVFVKMRLREGRDLHDYRYILSNKSFVAPLPGTLASL